MNPYRGFVAAVLAAVETARQAPLPRLADAPLAAPVAPEAPTVLIFAPHPDDECIIGGLPLRLGRECGWRMVNIGVTLGSKRERQAERRAELEAACAWLGFGLEIPGERGLERLNAATRAADPTHWAAAVAAVVAILRRERPRLICYPHATDRNTTHVGVHLLLQDALVACGPDFTCHIAETEFWSPMEHPNLCCAVSPADLADLIAALALHVGEVARNPYHLRLPGWMQDNVRRGAELVGGQGGVAPTFPFGTLYGLHRWTEGRRQRVESGFFIGESDRPDTFFPR